MLAHNKEHRCMSQLQEPSLQALTATAARARKDSEQGLLAKYHAMPIEGLQHLVDDPSTIMSAEQRDEIRRFLVLGKRLAKEELERQERIGNVYDKAGLPIAATGFSAYTWLVHFIGLTGTLRTVLDVLMFMAAVGVWLLLQWAAWRCIDRARSMLIDLGNVD
jgi:hypothetical protein